MMKKKTFVAVLLVLIMSVVICACGKNNSGDDTTEKDPIAQVEELLQGTWKQEVGDEMSVTAEYTFDHGEFLCTTYALGIALEPNEGTYEIKESIIKMSYDNEAEFEINYTLSGGELILTTEEGRTYQRVETMTPSEVTSEDVEDVALQKIYSYLQMVYGDFYDISASKYKVGKTDTTDEGYSVKGTLYLYDVYGSLDDTATFEVMVSLDSNGKLVADYPEIEIDY